MKIILLVIFQALAYGLFSQADTSSTDIREKRFRHEQLSPTIQQLLSDPRIDSAQFLMQLNGRSFELKMDQLENQKKNLNESRLKKGGKSLELMEEKTFNNASDARKYVLEKLTSTSLVVTDKTALTSFKIRVYEVSHAKEKEM